MSLKTYVPDYLQGACLSVRVTDFLPRPSTARVCDIDTREEITILTGDITHAINIGEVLFVSPQYYKQLLSQIN